MIILDILKRFSPLQQLKNPVMFVVYIGTLLTSAYILFNQEVSSFNIQIALWLWLTLLFANFAEAFSESRGKAQASSLKKSKIEHLAHLEGGKQVSSNELKKGDVVICTSGDIIPADGEVVSGVASVDESAITGESAPVIRESGGDRSAVTAGTRVISDQIKVCVTSEPGNTFLDRMIHMIEGAKRQKTPNEIALHIVLVALTIIFLLTTLSLKPMQDFLHDKDLLTLPILISLLVCLIPTTISALLNAVGIAGIDRLVKRNVIAFSGRAVEAAGDIDILILDKTGTITLGNREAVEFIPAKGYTPEQVAEIAQLASLSDETPEGRSIVVLAKNRYNLRAESLDPSKSHFIPFSAKTRLSGVDINENVSRSIRKGAPDAIKNLVEQNGGAYDPAIDVHVKEIALKGGTPLLVSEGNKVVGAVYLKDIIKGGIKERFKEMRKMGIKTVMVTGDNPMTAAAIAAEAGVDEFIAEATPEIKLKKIREVQADGHLVAMTGDGTNDAPALAQADVGVAMNNGTQASREAGNMIDLDSNPTKLIDVVEIGKQMLMTRGALTTFSIANDVAKYFAIIPAIFGTLYIGKEGIGPLSHLNVMHLHSPESAILSAVIFNALIIIALVPLALKGVKYKAESAQNLLRKNLLIYGLGGIVAPFIGIKMIDWIISSLGWV